MTTGSSYNLMPHDFKASVSDIADSVRSEALKSLSNKLYYNLKPSSASLIKERRTISYPAQRANYVAGDVMQVRVATGNSSFLDLTNSYLKWMSFKL